jgi:hypothetical protein
MRRGRSGLIAAVAGALFAVAPAMAADPPIVIAQLTVPTAITLDLDGDVWLASDNVVSALLTEHSPDGQLLRRFEYGNMASIGEGSSLITDPVNGNILELADDGRIDIVSPLDGSRTPWFALRDLDVDDSAAFDLVSGTTGQVGSIILTQAASYGDLALWRHDDKVEVFATGVYGTAPFVLRVTFGPSGLESSRLLAVSLGATVPLENLPRGLAVDPSGRVFTVLPREARYGGEDVDRAVVFGGLFDQGIGEPPTVILDDGSFSSLGLASDASGAFYGVPGGSSPGPCTTVPAVVRVDPALAGFSCVPVGSLLAEPVDLAVTPDGATAYVAMSGSGEVWRVSLSD